MGTEKLIRYRISVPKEDISITQWMECQANISHSIRTIIKSYIQEYGYTDATCQPVPMIKHSNSKQNYETTLSDLMEQNTQKVYTEDMSEPIQVQSEELVSQTISDLGTLEKKANSNIDKILDL